MCNDFNKYILDANAIRKLNYLTISEKKDKQLDICTIEDVEFEVKSLKKVETIPIRKLNPDAFLKIAELINSYKCLRDLVSYCENKGTADVALLAYSLTSDFDQLFKVNNIIVTDDHGLRVACDELNVKWMSVTDFQNI
jgi:hypothetical protein